MTKQSGFTLLDLMASVAIVGILAAMAVPQYNKYVTRSNRVAMQSELMQVSAALERYKAVQLSYTGASLANMYGSITSTYPKGSTGNRVLYNIVLGPPTLTGAPTVSGALSTAWELSAIPANKQTGSGLMKLNSLGQSCWNPDSDTNCMVTNTAQAWSGR